MTVRAAGSLSDQPAPDAHQLLPVRHDGHALVLRHHQGTALKGQGGLHAVFCRQGQYRRSHAEEPFLCSNEFRLVGK